MLNILTGNAFSWNEIIYVSVGAIFALVGSFSAQYLFVWIDNFFKRRNAGKQIQIELHSSPARDLNGNINMRTIITDLKIINYSKFLIRNYKITILEDEEFADKIHERFFRAIKNCELNSFTLPSNDFVVLDTMFNVRNNHFKYFQKNKLIKYEIKDEKDKLIKTDYIRFIDK